VTRASLSSSLYSRFKSLYSERHREWDELNLSFVFCLKRRIRELEPLCAQIETDAFFCRKFTISLDRPLESELAVLPFFPLDRPRVSSLRPPSAQTLLKSLGVPAGLASDIAGRVGEETIVEECLRGQFGQLRVSDGTQRDTSEVTEERTHSVRLKELQVRNFRAYRKLSVFDLDADLILLYGPNGFGKTSFFDAIDFAATGDIGRLHLDRSEQRFVKAAKHLDAGSEVGSVTLKFVSSENPNEIHQLRRRIDQRRKAVLDNRPAERKEALAYLTGTQDSRGADHVEHLVNLFRASHLFSQEFQTLTEDFRANCRLSSDIVSRMLTFEDYVGATRKLTKVLDLLTGRKVDREAKVREVTQQLKEYRKELSSFTDTLKVATNQRALNTLRRDVHGRLELAGIQPLADKDPLREVRGWRAVLEARIAEVRSIAARLDELSARLAPTQEQRGALTTSRAQIANLKASSDENEMQLKKLRESIVRFEEEVAALQKQERQIQDRLAQVQWFRDNKQTHTFLIERQSTLNTEIAELTNSLAEDEALTDQLRAQHHQANERLIETLESIVSAQKRLTELGELRGSHSSWQRAVSRREQVNTSKNTADVELTSIKTQLNTITKELSEAQSSRQKIAREVSEVEQAETELQNILAALERHVIAPSCPACGANHGSAERVIELLRERRNSTLASQDARSRLQVVDQKLLVLQQQRNNLSERGTAFENASAAAEAEIPNLDREIGSFQDRARSLNFDLVAMLEQIAKRHKDQSDKLTELNAKRQAQQQALDAALQQLSGAQARNASIRKTIDEKTVSLGSISNQLTQLLREARAREVIFDMSDEAARQAAEEAGRSINKIAESLQTKRAELDASRHSVADAQRNYNIVKRELENAVNTSRRFEGAIAAFESDAATLNLPAGITNSEIALKVEGARNQVRSLEELKESAAGLEMAVDASVTAAAATKLSENIRSAESDLSEIERKQTAENPWVSYFGRLNDQLQQTQNGAITRYTKDYGPMASIVQRRLRAVSGFDDLSLHPSGDAIDIRINRAGEALPPTDFFSQSQQQILILSLFLTACITQTWSAFAPILLDDPVSNFDDLNAYALLDLVAGLMGDGASGRQFILAICDERLLQLARQRFHYLGGRSVVYRLNALSSEGPAIDRLQ
jgi:exonuclease SbcC